MKVSALRNTRGFTLIELLVVVGLIAILTGSVVRVLNIKGIGAKGRDAQRVADLAKIQTALELYYADHRAYPERYGDCVDTVQLESFLVPQYLNKMPQDPNSPDSHYYYSSTYMGAVYVLAATMELADSYTVSSCAGLNNWGNVRCSGSNIQLQCYGVEAPFSQVNPSNCVAIGNACSSDTECCGSSIGITICDIGDSDTCCKTTGVSCKQSSECCGGDCTEGSCI